MARRWFHLPYFDALMSCKKSGDGTTVYVSERTHAGAPPAVLRAKYAATAMPNEATAATLDHWLTARYCLYAAGADGLLRGEISHPPWPLAPAWAEISENTMAAATGIELPDTAPLLHFVESLHVVCWSPERVS